MWSGASAARISMWCRFPDSVAGVSPAIRRRRIDGVDRPGWADIEGTAFSKAFDRSKLEGDEVRPLSVSKGCQISYAFVGNMRFEK